MADLKRRWKQEHGRVSLFDKRQIYKEKNERVKSASNSFVQRQLLKSRGNQSSVNRKNQTQMGIQGVQANIAEDKSKTLKPNFSRGRNMMVVKQNKLRSPPFQNELIDLPVSDIGPLLINNERTELINGQITNDFETKESDVGLASVLQKTELRNSKNLNSWLSPRSAKTNDSLKKVGQDIKITMGGNESQKINELALEHARKVESAVN